MALTSSPNPISADQIRTEFGATSGTSVRFGDYRAVNQTVGSLSGLPLDAGIPQSGPIGFGSFYSKRLNVVVDLYSGSAETRVDARTKYDANQITIIGGFKTAEQKPAAGAGSRIIANVNKLIGSEKGSRNYVALRTGTWGTDVNLEIVVGSNGKIIGAGGDGGNGGSFGANPNRSLPRNEESETAFNIGNISAGNGGDGSSALGIEYPTKVINGGVIRAGRGGGGGGGSGSGVEFHDISDCKNRRTSPLVGGGGGAGGSGLPVGNGGQFGDYLSRLWNKNRGSTTMPTKGTSASATVNGQGGSGGSVVPADYPSTKCSAIKIAVSGAGGAAESDGGDGNNAYTSRGLGGKRGYAIIITSTGSLVGGSISGNASDGDTLNPGTIT